MGGIRAARVLRRSRGICLLCAGLLGLVVAAGSPSAAYAVDLWGSLIDQAGALGLPTRFLRAIAPDFLTIEYEDLRTYAAEYHPDTHRMVLNRTLSLNAAGGVLRPLRKLSHQDLSTLFHELFHAYFDYLVTNPKIRADNPDAARLMAVAEAYRRCRYEQVLITPVVQRKSVTERRFLSPRESWEALNETWAVFVGWAIWTELELGLGREAGVTPKEFSRWVTRLKKADGEAILVGYYAPESEEEQRVTGKRHLAPQQKISPEEAAGLLEIILEFPASRAHQAAAAMAPSSLGLPGSPACPA